MTQPPRHPNLDVVNNVFKAMLDGDREKLWALHHPDVVLHVSGTGPHAGDYVGQDEVLRIGTSTEASDGSDTMVVHDLLWSPEHVVALVHVSVERDGDRLDQNVVQVIHVLDGQVREIWEYLWDQQADRVFWSRH